MFYFLQRADIQGNSSLSLQETLMCCHIEKKGCRKAGGGKFSNQTGNERHKEVPEKHTVGGIRET